MQCCCNTGRAIQAMQDRPEAWQTLTEAQGRKSVLGFLEITTLRATLVSSGTSRCSFNNLLVDLPCHANQIRNSSTTKEISCHLRRAMRTRSTKDSVIILRSGWAVGLDPFGFGPRCGLGSSSIHPFSILIATEVRMASEAVALTSSYSASFVELSVPVPCFCASKIGD
jgi:hypothetical protein